MVEQMWLRICPEVSGQSSGGLSSRLSSCSKVSLSKNSVNYLYIRNYDLNLNLNPYQIIQYCHPQISCVQSNAFQILPKLYRFFAIYYQENGQVVFTLWISILRAVASTSYTNYRFQNFQFYITCAQPWPLQKSTQKYLICLGICFCKPPLSFSILMMLLWVFQLPSMSSSACLKKKGRSQALLRGRARHQVQMCELSLENCSKKTTCRSYLSKAWMRHFLQLVSSVRMSSLRPMLVCSWSTGARMKWNMPSKVLYLASARQTQLDALSRARSSLSGQQTQQFCTLFDAIIGLLRFFISFLTFQLLSLPQKVMLQSNLPFCYVGFCCIFCSAEWAFSASIFSISVSVLPARKRRKHSSYI